MHHLSGEVMFSRAITHLLCSSVLLCGSTSLALAQYSQAVDARSYQLGILGGFSEVVRLGVKQLALSEVMSPEEMDDILPDAQVIADRNDVLLYRETDLLISDLYPADVARDKHVLLVYTGDTLEKYLALKADRQALVDTGRYSGEARTDIARRFGRLLSYPRPVIDELIRKQRGH